jgi:chorismate-pyruvate lyase
VIVVVRATRTLPERRFQFRLDQDFNWRTNSMTGDVRKGPATLPTLPLWTFPTYADTALPSSAHTWPNSFVARLEASLLIQTLNADLLSHDSATLTLERWCSAHRLATSPRIVAERVTGVDKTPTEEQRRELGVAQTDLVRYRRVRLLCGTVVLSEADNWYVPGRLTPEMNKVLNTTNTPFGRAVQALHFQRHTISAKVLWTLLPEEWEMSSAAPIEGVGELPLPSHVLEHRAVLTLPDGTPFSEVVETYTGNVLAFPIQQ